MTIFFFLHKKNSSSNVGAKAHRFGLCSQRSVSIVFFFMLKKKTIIMKMRVNHDYTFVHVLFCVHILHDTLVYILICALDMQHTKIGTHTCEYIIVHALYVCISNAHITTHTYMWSWICAHDAGMHETLPGPSKNSNLGTNLMQSAAKSGLKC